MDDLPELDPTASEAQQAADLKAWLERERERQGIAADGSRIIRKTTEATP